MQFISFSFSNEPNSYEDSPAAASAQRAAASPASRILCQIVEKVGRTSGESVGYNEGWDGRADYFGGFENGVNKDAYPHDHTALARKKGWIRVRDFQFLGNFYLGFVQIWLSEGHLLPADFYEIYPT